MDKICCIINSAIEQDVTRSQTPESPSVSGGLPESGVNTVLSDETQPEEIKRCKVCKTTDRGKDPGGPACDSCSVCYKFWHLDIWFMITLEWCDNKTH